MAKDAVDKIIKAEAEGKGIREKANAYLKQSLEQAEADREKLFKQKKEEAENAASDIISQAKQKAEDIIASANETSKKELHALRQTVLEKNDKLVLEIINLI